MQELRKASGQQLREVQVTQGEVSKQLRDERQQAERKKAQLKVRGGGGWVHTAAVSVCGPGRALKRLLL
jgi:hypothetical protein